VAALFGVLCAAVIALSTGMGTDYASQLRPIMDSLASGNFGPYFGHQPQMGQFSVLLRWPAAALGGGPLADYRGGVFVCLLAPVVLATLLSRGRSIATSLLIVVALVASPVVIRAVELGHPEELLAAALCAGSLWLAISRRAGWAAVALGLALATKQWALLAVLPVFFAVEGERRWQTLGIAAAVAALFTIPPLLIDPGAFKDSLKDPVTGVAQLRPGNLWSLVIGPQSHVTTGGGDSVAITTVPDWLRSSAHAGIAVICGLIAIVASRWVRRPADMFVVLALIFLARCALDPWNHEYYHVPFLTALACWEVLARKRAPVATLASSAILWLVFVRLVGDTGGAPLGADIVYMVWAATAATALVYVLRVRAKGAAAVPIAAARMRPRQIG
jgi:hypothetical protein